LLTESDRPAQRRFLSNVRHVVWPDPVPLSVDRLPALDGLRGLALLGVLATHLYFGAIFDNGYLGLTIFFVLSGYLIAVLLLEQLKHGVFLPARFMYRRFRRLVPPLAIVSVVTLLLTPQVSRTQALSAATGLKGLEAYRPHGRDFADPLGHTWSLTVEFIFYSVAAIAITAARSGRGRRLLGLLVASTSALLLTSLFVILGGVGGPSLPEDLRFFSPFLRLGEPLAGMALALAIHGRKTPSRWAALFFVGLGLLSCAPLARALGIGSVGSALTLATLLTCFLITTTRGTPHTWPAKLLEMPTLTNLGRASYLVYLVHFPVYSAAQSAGLGKLTSPVCLAGTVVSYVLLRRVLLLGRPGGALASSVAR